MAKKWISQFDKETHTIFCRECKISSKEAPKNVVTYECWICINRSIPDPKPVNKYVPSGHPRGWKWMGVYVDKDQNVYHRGVIQPELKGTLPPTPRKPSKPKKKKADIIANKVKEYNRKKRRKKK